jgi:glucose-6-phosphate 1-dehydrogenase
MCIQPDEGIHLTFQAKVPDSEQDMRSVDMEFHYESFFEGVTLPDAYERLLEEALQGDPSLFTRNDGIEAAWALMDPIITAWEEEREREIPAYSPGNWGPEESDQLLGQDGRKWHLSCGTHERCIRPSGNV